MVGADLVSARNLRVGFIRPVSYVGRGTGSPVSVIPMKMGIHPSSPPP